MEEPEREKNNIWGKYESVKMYDRNNSFSLLNLPLQFYHIIVFIVKVFIPK